MSNRGSLVDNIVEIAMVTVFGTSLPQNMLYSCRISIRHSVKNILTIAGFDPSSGAGITRDLDTFFSLGFHGIAAPTSIIVQGPQGVRDIHPVASEAFTAILLSIQKELKVDGIKVGAMVNEEYVDILSAFVSQYPHVPVVVDPVLTAKNGKELLNERGLKSLVQSVFPMATVVTPNLDEASRLRGETLTTLRDMEECARALAAQGPQAVVMKGGHLRGEPTDLLFDGSECTVWKRRRIDRTIHGTGCMFSSALVSFLASGYSLKEAFLASESFMDTVLNTSYQVSEEGYFYGSSGVLNSGLSERWKVLQAMSEARQRLNLLNLSECIPGVHMKMGYGLHNARGPEDVAAFPGKISYDKGRIIVEGEACFGASPPVARLILSLMEHFPHLRSCAIFSYDRKVIKQARERGLTIVFLDRVRKPSRANKEKVADRDFIMVNALEGMDNPPDIIYDEGDLGREPMIRVFARNPLELLKKMEMIVR